MSWISDVRTRGEIGKATPKAVVAAHVDLEGARGDGFSAVACSQISSLDPLYAQSVRQGGSAPSNQKQLLHVRHCWDAPLFGTLPI
jgi:hypothetical protein